MLAKIWSFAVLLILVLVFFRQLFIPDLAIPVTPDFGRSDILHLNYPLKNFLSQSLKNRELPIWNPQIGSGFPTLGEGQTGAFNLINLFFFGLFPMPLAFNLAFLVSYVLAALFTYLFAREIGLKRLPATVSGITFALSGFFVAHHHHFNLLQTAMFLPLELLLFERLLTRGKVGQFLIFFPLVASQQIFAGFPQIALYSFITCLLYFTFRSSWWAKKTIFNLIFIGYAFLITFLIAQIQLAPQKELLDFSSRTFGLASEQIDQYPYPPKSILMFFTPFIFGNPREGTFAPYNPQWGIFWENSAYVGILTLILAIGGSILALGDKKYRSYSLPLLIIAGICLILVMGKFSPFYFLLSAPPFNLFRVPQRFLLPVVFSLSVLGGVGLQLALEKLATRFNLRRLIVNALGAIALLIIFLDLFFTWASYPAYGRAKDWLKAPQTAQILSDDPSMGQFRIYSFLASEPWNSVFLNKGWDNQLESYKNFRSSLDPNMNQLFGVSQAWVYESLLTRRLETWHSLVEKEFTIDPPKGEARLSPLGLRLLSMQAVKYLVSPVPIKNEDLELVAESQATNLSPSYLVYRNQKVLPRAHLVGGIRGVNTLDGILAEIRSDNFNPDQEVVIEFNETLKSRGTVASNGSATITKAGTSQINIKTYSESKSVLVLADTIYPGWKVRVDGKDAPILNANLNQRAVALEAGDHQVSFIYEPVSLEKGTKLSLIGLGMWLLTAFFLRIFPKVAF